MFAVRGLYGQYSVQDAALSKGGMGSIHRTSDPNFVYKNYFDPQKAPDRENLERLVSVGRTVLIEQARTVGDTPDSSVNWPVDVIPGPNGRGAKGVLLPVIPRALFHEEFEGVRGLEFLVMARAKPPAAKGRIVLLLRMAEILSFVHARGLVHGDVNSKNLAWTVRPRPIMYLIDCDGMVPQRPAPSAGVSAMGWTDPRLTVQRIAAHDQYSDWYALALAMYRGLLLTPGVLDRTAQGTWPAPTRIPTDFPPPLADLMRRGLDPLEADRRPEPAQWVRALVTTYLPNQHFDESAVAALDRVSTPTPKPPPVVPPAFVPLPVTDWNPAAPPGRPRPPPPAPPGQHRPPFQPAPVPPRPVVPSRPPWGPQPASPSRQWAPAPPSIQAYRGPSGSLAQAAVDAPVSWYVKGALATLLLPMGALVYVLIGRFQLRTADDDFPGVAKARNSLIAFAVASGVWSFMFILGSVS